MSVVIKIGGSLFRNADALGRVTRVLSRLRGKYVIVTGGGALADQVREAQRKLKFNDETAHNMAVLAMEQNALALTGLMDAAVGVRTTAAFRDAWERGVLPVWLPAGECAHDEEIIRSWQMTSDSIAARLAQRMGDTGVILFKSCPVDPAWSLDVLVDRGIVDPKFPSVVQTAATPYRIVGDADPEALSAALNLFDKAQREESKRERLETRP